MHKTLNWLVHYGSLTVELTRLLGITFLPGDKHYLHPINIALNYVVDFHNRGEFDLRERELAELAFLVDNLQTIEKYDHELFSYFRRELLRHQSFDNYYGPRFEVSTCASLIKKKLHFNIGRKDVPDFSVHHLGDRISIECLSLHFGHERMLRVLRKVRSGITKKARLPLNKAKTVVFIEITNLRHSELRNKSKMVVDPVHAIKHIGVEAGFGSIIAFTYYFDVNTRTFGSAYNRIDSSLSAPALTAFLNCYYQIGEFTTEIVIPPRG